MDEGSISVPAFRQYVQMAQTCQLDIEPFLHQADISAELLKDPGARISESALIRFLSQVIPASNEHLFGLYTSDFVQPSCYGVLGYIVMNCAHLEEALVQVPLYEKIVGDMGVTSTLKVGHEMFVRWQCQLSDPLIRRHVTDNVLASWVRFARWITQTQAAPRQVYLAHARPQGASLSDYQSVFGCPVVFEQPESGLVIDAETLALPIHQADDQLLFTLLEHGKRVLDSLNQQGSFVDKVKVQLRLMYKDQVPRKENIAAQLGMNERTLQRKLKREGIGYQSLFNQVRLEMTLHYLKNTSLSLDEISRQIGFSEPRSFHRSFKQWTGKTAGVYRKELLEI